MSYVLFNLKDNFLIEIFEDFVLHTWAGSIDRTNNEEAADLT